MIVKFHPRGRGGGAGPVDYLLGKDRNRDGASILQGKPEEVRELIDASPYAKKYTSGVLSFAECVFRSIRSRIGIEVRSAIRIYSINRELNFSYCFLTCFFVAFHCRFIFPH